MNFDDIYGSRYLKGTDLHFGKIYPLTVINFEIEMVKKERAAGAKEEPQILLHFSQTKKGLGVNKTNADRIAEYYGKDFNAWIGQTVYLRLESVDAFGEQHDVVRVLPRRENPRFEQQQSAPLAGEPAPGGTAIGAAATPQVQATAPAAAPVAPEASPAPASAEQGFHQAIDADPFADIGKPAAGEIDDFDDDIPFTWALTSIPALLGVAQLASSGSIPGVV